jgi:short-subunit dehydrogenase
MWLNIYGPIVAMQAVIPSLRQVGGGGAIVNISSGKTKRLREGGSVYLSTKQVVQRFSKVARLELASDKIVVMVVHPYITDTNFFAHLDPTRRQTLLK